MLLESFSFAARDSLLACYKSAFLRMQMQHIAGVSLSESRNQSIVTHNINQNSCRQKASTLSQAYSQFF
jgi:hypothetical protein